MITSIMHPLVFIALVLSDVLENTFCLWSLARNVSNRVVPEGASEIEEKTLSRRRSSNILSLVFSKKNVMSDKGTSLFIGVTLLQREAIEILVPMQAAAILSLLHIADVKSNSIVSSDWSHSMMYIGIDLGVELVVFTTTISAFSRIYPEFNVWRILKGLLRMHWMEMCMTSVCVWLLNLLFQSTYSGMDMSMKFDWIILSCIDGPSSNYTWLGGFKWECNYDK